MKVTCVKLMLIYKVHVIPYKTRKAPV